MGGAQPSIDETSLFNYPHPMASSTGTSYLPAQDGYRQASIPPSIEFATQAPPYVPQQVKTANILGLIILSALALIPIYRGLIGLISVGVIIALFAVLGSA